MDVVKSYWKEIYKPFVDSFNEKHSDCQVILKTDYYKSKILEKAQVGEGPVLIDSFITGFEEQKDLWEPIDDVYEREELQDANNQRGACGEATAIFSRLFGRR